MVSLRCSVLCLVVKRGKIRCKSLKNKGAGLLILCLLVMSELKKLDNSVIISKTRVNKLEKE